MTVVSTIQGDSQLVGSSQGEVSCIGTKGEDLMAIMLDVAAAMHHIFCCIHNIRIDL